jgi:hypothetical protein
MRKIAYHIKKEWRVSMLIIILLIAIPLLTVIKVSLFNGNYLLWGLSFMVYLMICAFINKTNQDIVIALVEALVLFIYVFGILFQILYKDKVKKTLNN